MTTDGSTKALQTATAAWFANLPLERFNKRTGEYVRITSEEALLFARHIASLFSTPAPAEQGEVNKWDAIDFRRAGWRRVEQLGDTHESDALASFLNAASAETLAALSRCEAGAAEQGEIERLRHKLWMVACHATGGGIPEIGGIDRSVNDICVQISAHRNEVYQAGKDAASHPSSEAIPAGYVMVPRDCTDEIAEAIAGVVNVCGGIAETIWSTAMLAASPQARAE